MLFALQGFSHRKSIRVFRFQRLDSAFLRTNMTVDVDLQALAEFHIPVQEAPLLCRQLLERQPEDEARYQFLLSREDMKSYADAAVAARARNIRKPVRPHARPQTDNRPPQTTFLQKVQTL